MKKHIVISISIIVVLLIILIIYFFHGNGVMPIYERFINETVDISQDEKDKEVEVKSITLNCSKENIVIGDDRMLTVTINPSNATNKNIKWKSDNPKVIEVINGKIKAIGSGTSYVTAEANNGVSAKCLITVHNKEVSVTGVSLNKTSVSLNKGDKLILSATISPSNATNKKITWSSSNQNVATVDNGNVTAVGVGSAIIGVKTSNGKIATCQITVSNKEVLVTGVSLNKTSTSLNKGDKFILSATISPSNATNKKITWSSSNQNVATVDNGNVTAVGVGNATITAKTSNGKIATCQIIVSQKEILINKLTLDKSSLKIEKAASTTLKATISPSNATNNKLTWSSSNQNVVTVDNGKITAKGIGEAVVTVKSSNNIKASCTVTVTKKGVNIKVATLNIGAFKCGTSGTNCSSTSTDYSNIINKNNIDIIGMQEAYPNRTVQRIADNINYSYFIRPYNTIISKYSLTDKKDAGLKYCKSSNYELDKSIVNVNGIDISFYVTHFSYVSNCHEVHFQSVANILSKDTNPIILVGDFNVETKYWYETYFKPIGIELASYDTTSNNLSKKPTYCDAVYFLSKGHISKVNGGVIPTFATLTDHNLVYATLKIY